MTFFFFFKKKTTARSANSEAVTEIDNKLEDIQDDEGPAAVTTPKSSEANDGSVLSEERSMDTSLMSESIYQKLSSPRSVKHKSISRLIGPFFCIW